MTVAKRWGKERGAWLECGFLKGDEQQGTNQLIHESVEQPV